MLSKTKSQSPVFVRDQVAWLCYLMIGTYCYVSAALGPMMTFLRSELHLNYTVAAYHFSVWSLGVVAAGFTGDKCMKRFGKRRTVWIACSGFCLGICIIIGATNPIATIFAAFLCGLNGSTMSQTLCTIMAERFSELRAIAITEANIAASLFCSLAPLAVGALSQTALGWRAALVLPIVCFCFYFICAGQSLQTASELKHKNKSASTDRLPKSYWLCWSLIFFSVASEWSIIFWSADFLEKIVKLAKSDAVACVTPFLVAMVTGRVLGSRLARQMSSRTLLRAASLVAISGFGIFWLNKSALLCVAGLFIAGLGISNFYPLTLSMAIGSAPGLTSKATARMSLASGGSTLLAPLLLGLVAERSGIFAAYGIVAALLLLCSLMISLPVWADSGRDAASL